MGVRLKGNDDQSEPDSRRGCSRWLTKSVVIGSLIILEVIMAKNSPPRPHPLDSSQTLMQPCSNPNCSNMVSRAGQRCGSC